MDLPAANAPTIRLADMATRRDTGSPSMTRRRIRVLLNAGNQIMRGHAVSIGAERLVVSVPSPLHRDHECAVFFGLTIAEQMFSIIGTGRVTECTGSESAGYNAEMEFTVSDKKSRIALEQLFNSDRSNCIQ